MTVDDQWPLWDNHLYILNPNMFSWTHKSRDLLKAPSSCSLWRLANWTQPGKSICSSVRGESSVMVLLRDIEVKRPLNVANCTYAYSYASTQALGTPQMITMWVFHKLVACCFRRGCSCTGSWHQCVPLMSELGRIMPWEKENWTQFFLEL